MGDIRIYRIRQRSTGLWSSGGSDPKFGKRGKTWDQIGHLSSHMTSLLDSQGRKAITNVYDDAEVVEFVLAESESRTFDARQMLERKKRAILIQKKHGYELSDLITKLEKGERIESYRWCVVFPAYNNGKWAQDDISAWFKTNKGLLKRDNHVRIRTTYAFNDRSLAAQIRLSSPFDTKGIDLVEFVEDF
jgi:hypothetical protein